MTKTRPNSNLRLPVYYDEIRLTRRRAIAKSTRFGFDLVFDHSREIPKFSHLAGIEFLRQRTTGNATFITVDRSFRSRLTCPTRNSGSWKLPWTDSVVSHVAVITMVVLFFLDPLKLLTTRMKLSKFDRDVWQILVNFSNFSAR